MIDHDLIEKSTSYSIDVLRSQYNSNDLCLLNDFLHTDLLVKLEEFLAEFDEWELRPNHVYKEYRDTRNLINWVPDSVVEESHTVMQNLTECIGNLFQKDLRFIGITLWKDSENFMIFKHTDNPQIEVAIQIYLSGGIDNLGTVFEVGNSIIKANYRKNSGYIMDNSKQIPHYTEIKVPKDHVRYSLYARWALNQ